MNGIVSQFHKEFPQYKKTKVVVDWIPWETGPPTGEGRPAARAART